MALHKRGEYWYGQSQADIRTEMERYGKQNAYVPTQFADAQSSIHARLPFLDA